MAKSVNGAFNEFLQNTVNIKKTDSDKAKSSRDFLVEQINYISSNGKFLKLALEYNCYFGSFSRKTKICELDDVDIIIGLNGGELEIVTYYQWDDITLKLKKDCTDSMLIDSSDKVFEYSGYTYYLNSNKVKNKLVSQLSNISQYEKADIHARGEAVTLKLKSYPWNFDIVPGFYTGDEVEKPFYLIPNGKGKWKKTNPKIEQKRITELNKKFNGTVLQTVRLVKYWNKRGKMPKITSYVLETMVLDYFDQAQHYLIKFDGSTIDYHYIHFRDALLYIVDHIFWDVQDSKGIQGNINNIPNDYRYKISDRAQSDYKKACSAVYAEIYEKNMGKAFNIWRDIFGEEFPKYE